VEGGWLNSNAIMVVEDKAVMRVPTLLSHIILDERKFGDTKIWIAKFQLK
jgi:16S rRNA G966 N2-methylase RsmD